jgi:hypothetical protein
MIHDLLPDLGGLPDLGYLLTPRYLYMAGAVFALLLVVWAIHSYRRHHRDIIPFASPDGDVVIAPQTLRAVLQFAVCSIDGVEKATCSHFHTRRGIGIQVAIHLRTETKLRLIELEIKRRVRACLLDHFGMENVDPVRIRVTRLIGDPVLLRNQQSTTGQQLAANRQAVDLDPFEAALDEDK